MTRCSLMDDHDTPFFSLGDKDTTAVGATLAFLDMGSKLNASVQFGKSHIEFSPFLLRLPSILLPILPSSGSSTEPSTEPSTKPSTDSSTEPSTHSNPLSICQCTHSHLIRRQKDQRQRVAPAPQRHSLQGPCRPLVALVHSLLRRKRVPRRQVTQRGLLVRPPLPPFRARTLHSREEHCLQRPPRSEQSRRALLLPQRIQGRFLLRDRLVTQLHP